MARKLAATVHVTHGGQRHSLLAGTTPEPELAALVTNEAAWEADEPEPESGGTTEPADTPAPEPEPEPTADAEPADESEPSSRPRAKRRQG